MAGAQFARSTEPTTQQEINFYNNKYSTVGANSQINKGLGWARKFYDKRN